MPRKQRFKPTRKPKPVPTSEVINSDALIGQRASDSPGNPESGATSTVREQPAQHTAEQARSE